MHDVERELIKVTNYKTQRKFSDRQDYLKSILNAIMKLTDDDFNNISDEAAAWTNAAVEMHNSKKGGELPDFDEVEPSEDDDTTSDDEATDDAEGDEEASEDDVEGTEDDADVDLEDDTADEETSGTDDDESDDEPEEKPAKKQKAKAKAAPEKPAKTKAPAPIKKQKAKAESADDDEDVVLDKWGCMEGSKNGQALGLFEKGATTKEVKDKIGGTYYNILGKMVEKGHKMAKEGALITITHKDDVREKAAPKPIAKKGKK